MEYTATVPIDASAEQVWAVLARVADWPSWTPTIESLELVDGSELASGASVAIKQPHRRIVNYVVEDLTPGESFVWGSTRGGVRQWATHSVRSTGARSSTVRLIFGLTGWAGTPLGRLAAGRIRAMVDLEAASLKARVEGASGEQRR